MKILLTLLLFAVCCTEITAKEINAEKYFEHINKAELAICKENFGESLAEYESAFAELEKPFGKDVFNAALDCQLMKDYKKRDFFVQQIINNSDDVEYVKAVFVGKYMTEKHWETLMAKRTIAYDIALRKESKEIEVRDQIFRPRYDTKRDTINANWKINIDRILALTSKSGLPSQVELGYSKYLSGQDYDIVLHHTAQMRSMDKRILDLEPILRAAVNNGRFDPEQAIFYLNFQNDLEKGEFFVFSTWQNKHPLLPDSLNNKVWFPKLDQDRITKINEKRKEWFADSYADAITKTNFRKKSRLPFRLNIIRASVGNFPTDLNEKEAFEQYKIATDGMIEM